jgi:hypothetical protein
VGAIWDHSRAKRPPEAEAEVVVPGAGGVPVAVGRAEVLWLEEPGTGANDTAIAVTTGPRRAIGGRPVVVVVIAILTGRARGLRPSSA